MKVEDGGVHRKRYDGHSTKYELENSKSYLNIAHSKENTNMPNIL
jgi:hypothetical protein